MLKEADSSGADKKDITWKKLADFVNNSASQTHSSTVYDLANTYYGDFLRYYQEQEMNGFTLIVNDYGRFWAAIFALKSSAWLSDHLQECFWYNGNDKENLITEFMRH